MTKLKSTHRSVFTVVTGGDLFAPLEYKLFESRDLAYLFALPSFCSQCVVVIVKEQALKHAFSYLISFKYFNNLEVNCCHLTSEFPTPPPQPLSPTACPGSPLLWTLASTAAWWCVTRQPGWIPRADSILGSWRFTLWIQNPGSDADSTAITCDTLNSVFCPSYLVWMSHNDRPYLRELRSEKTKHIQSLDWHLAHCNCPETEAVFVGLAILFYIGSWN